MGTVDALDRNEFQCDLLSMVSVLSTPVQESVAGSRECEMLQLSSGAHVVEFANPRSAILDQESLAVAFLSDVPFRMLSIEQVLGMDVPFRMLSFEQVLGMDVPFRMLSIEQVLGMDRDRIGAYLSSKAASAAVANPLEEF